MLDKVFTFFPVLGERRNQAGGTLSGGEQQMLAIARAMWSWSRESSCSTSRRGLMPRMGRRSGRILDVLQQRGCRDPAGRAERAVTLEGEPARLHHGERCTIRHHAVSSSLNVNDPVIQQYLEF